MTQIVVYDEETMSEIPTVYAITLLQDTSQRHKQEELEHARLQAAFAKCVQQVRRRPIS